MTPTLTIEGIFISILSENIDSLRNGAMPKGKFIGKYMEAINNIDKENAFRYKRPQVIGEGKNPENNWLDYIITMPENEYIYFRQTL